MHHLILPPSLPNAKKQIIFQWFVKCLEWLKRKTFVTNIADVPSAEISTDSEVMFGLKTTITSAVLSCPTPDEVEWQSSNDGKTFCRIDVSEPHYYGSSLSPESPLLVIPYTTLDDMLHYRLLLRNKIGEQCSNTLYLKVTGCKFSACRVIEYSLFTCKVDIFTIWVL